MAESFLITVLVKQFIIILLCHHVVLQYHVLLQTATLVNNIRVHPVSRVSFHAKFHLKSLFCQK